MPNFGNSALYSPKILVYDRTYSQTSHICFKFTRLSGSIQTKYEVLLNHQKPNLWPDWWDSIDIQIRNVLPGRAKLLGTLANLDPFLEVNAEDFSGHLYNCQLSDSCTLSKMAENSYRVSDIDS